jgi:hypothetical protein
MKDYTKAFDIILNKLKNKENFAFTRFSDGELDIMKNKYVILANNYFISGNHKGNGKYTKEEQKEFIPEKHSFYRKFLLETFKHNQPNYFKGICTSTDAHVGRENFQWMLFEHGGDHPNLTFANLLINANYERFVEEIVPLFKEREIIYIVNELADTTRLPFKISKEFKIGSNCMIENFNTVEAVKTYIAENNIKDAIVLCSAASLSNFIIYQCFKENNQNTFLDIGSCLNPLLNLEGWKYTRGYLTSYWLGHNNHYGRQKDTWQ